VLDLELNCEEHQHASKNRKAPKQPTVPRHLKGSKLRVRIKKSASFPSLREEEVHIHLEPTSNSSKGASQKESRRPSLDPVFFDPVDYKASSSLP